MQFSKTRTQLAQLGLHARERALGQHAVGKSQRFVGLAEAAAEEIVEALGMEELADRAIRQPVEIARHVQADAVARHQGDQVQAVQVQQLLQALGFAQPVHGQHVAQGPVIQGAYRDQQQLGIRHQLFLLGRRQRAQPAFAERRFLGQLGQGEAEQVADLDQAVDAQRFRGQQALDAGFGQVQRRGDVAVGLAL